jgi:uncharacterized protein YbjT (DUF2867 family)
MYAITGITGRVGGIVARRLLADGKNVRAVVRDVNKGAAWIEQGCEVVVADMRDSGALQTAFQGAEAVFVLLPPTFDPTGDFAETREMVAALRNALQSAQPGRVVCISTIGAQAAQSNLLTQLQILEQELGALDLPITFLRPAWFMENFAWDISSAMQTQQIASFLQPLDKPFPMVACADVGRVAAELLQENLEGKRVVELEGARRITPNEVAASFSRILGSTVHATVVDPVSWSTLFMQQGMCNPMPRIQMLQGFNAGWIEFENGSSGSRKGRVELDTVIRALIGEK